mmetsp:Transcript_6634/g.16314  ORF Transcript_6634/g.16314 Transcript_6634/m.16314 type:complete len:147 (-) Transcript_6634:43-483(-)
MMSCEFYTERRARCHGVYGQNRGEECLHEDLTEKRCLSAERCPKQALEYYGTSPREGFDGASGTGGAFPGTGTLNFEALAGGGYQKALCASWAESFAYADKELEHGEEVARHHREARRIVSNDSKLQKECRQLARDLAECFRATKK